MVARLQLTLWGCTVKDADGIDICKGLGANVTAAATVYKADNDGLETHGRER